MIQHTGPNKAPPTPTSSLDTQTPEQPAHVSSKDQEPLNNAQGINLQMPSVMAIATEASKELTAPIATPALVVKKGTCEFDTGSSIKVEALTVAA